MLKFGPDVEFQDIRIKIMDDEEWEGHEEFYVELYEPASANGGKCVLGPNSRTQVSVIDDDDPGMVAFEKEAVTAEEHADDFVLRVRVLRNYGSKGEISCRYHT